MDANVRGDQVVPPPPSIDHLLFLLFCHNYGRKKKKKKKNSVKISSNIVLELQASDWNGEKTLKNNNELFGFERSLSETSKQNKTERSLFSNFC